VPASPSHVFVAANAEVHSISATIANSVRFMAVSYSLIVFRVTFT
jgi:hypothetical protein